MPNGSEQRDGMAGWVATHIKTFLRGDRSSFVDALARQAAERSLLTTDRQVRAWDESLEFLRDALMRASDSIEVNNWGLLLEYEIPRRGHRPDAVLLAGTTIFVLEFKCWSTTFDRAALLQTAEYAQDLRDFHAESRGHVIAPTLIATASVDGPSSRQVEGCSLVVDCVGSSGELAEVFFARARKSSPQLDLNVWNQSAYQPTPDILSAAREVFAGNSVREISFAHADNLDGTVDFVRSVIDAARFRSEHTVVFVTGVPGSGKTLAGLSATHQATPVGGSSSAPLGAYLSGNGPLVEVLRYALAKDKRARDGTPKAEAERIAKTFIQPVRFFVDEYLDESKTPTEHVIVFDEAQRAWNARHMWSKMKIDKSQAAVVLDAMSRKSQWSVVVALVGEGQEINLGEAGIEEWANALETRPEWVVHVAPDLQSKFAHLGSRVVHSPALHLSVSVRSPRAQAIADWADAVVQGRLESARQILTGFPEFPILLTRSLATMKAYLRDRSSPDRRTGLLASSQARRLRAFGMEVAGANESSSDWPLWFVEDLPDIRSSSTLEVVASEFKVQGLELDWVGLGWGQDFAWSALDRDWVGRRLWGTTWKTDSDMTYARNRYRVLLTRARYGMVIWVPEPRGHEPLVDPTISEANVAALLQAGASWLET